MSYLKITDVWLHNAREVLTEQDEFSEFCHALIEYYFQKSTAKENKKFVFKFQFKSRIVQSFLKGIENQINYSLNRQKKHLNNDLNNNEIQTLLKDDFEDVFKSSSSIDTDNNTDTYIDNDNVKVTTTTTTTNELSSSSSSLSVFLNFLLENGCESSIAQKFEKIARMGKFSTNEKAQISLVNEIKLSGLTFTEAIAICVQKEWKTFKNVWYQEAFHSSAKKESSKPPLLCTITGPEQNSISLCTALLSQQNIKTERLFLRKLYTARMNELQKMHSEGVKLDWNASDIWLYNVINFTNSLHAGRTKQGNYPNTKLYTHTSHDCTALKRHDWVVCIDVAVLEKDMNDFINEFTKLLMI